jgi:hypothetical protein
MLKLARITRIAKVIRNLNIGVSQKVALKIFQLGFYLVLYIHVFACIWYIICQVKEDWVLNMDFIWYDQWMTREVWYTDQWVRQYILCYYTGFFLFGVGEVVPREELEFVCAIFILLISAIVNAIIIGNMAIHSEELSRKSTEFQQKIDLVNTAMTNLSLPKVLTKEVHVYISNTHNTLDRQSELQNFV